MTAVRRRGKPPAVAIAFAGLLAATCMGGGFAPLAAATTERIVTDHHTGLAIAGFDPVAYFTDARARAGRGDLELRLAGVVWRFTNEGNRAAFAAHPEIYLPAFGGYDPTAVARGVAVPGHPEVWLIVQQRLYLFHTTQTRAAFAAEPARRQWSDVLRVLAP